MRRGFGLLGLVMTVVVLAIVGVIAYNVGWSDGLATHVPAGTDGAPQYYYGYGPHPFGWGFGILWFFFILFGLFFLFRIAFFGRRRWGGGGWGYKGGGYGHGMPPGQKTEFDERMQEWHKRAHGEQPPAASTPPPPPPDQRSV